MLRRSFFGSLAALPLLAVAGPKPHENNRIRVVTDVRFASGNLIVDYATIEAKDVEPASSNFVLSFAECE